MDKGLQLDRGAGADGADLVQAQLAGQDHAPDADLLQKGHPLGGVVVHLRAGDQGDGRQVAFQQAHVLDDDGVDAQLVELVDQAHGLGQLVVVEQRVDGDVHPRPVGVGVLHQRGDVVQRVADPGPRAKARRADVDGVGAAVDGRDAARQVSGRCQQFYSLFHGRHYTRGSSRDQKTGQLRRLGWFDRCRQPWYNRAAMRG